MVKVIAKSEVFKLFDDEFFEIQTEDAEHEALLSKFADAIYQGSLSPVSLSSTQFVFGGSLGAYDFKMVISGNGIGPFNSLAAFEQAFDKGLATGAITDITITGSKRKNPEGPAIPDTDFLNLSVTPVGYTLTSGTQILSVTGALPTSLTQLFDLGDVIDDLGDTFPTMTTAQQNQVIAQLSAYGLSGFSVQSHGVELFAFSAETDAVSLRLMGYSVTLEGSFPANLGTAVPFLFQVLNSLENGSVLDFSNISGFSVTGLKVTNPEGAVILKTIGNLGTSETIDFGAIKIDGVKVSNLIMGENQEAYDWFGYPMQGDNIVGTNGSDHIFGLAGNDYLVGGKGRDFLFGGSGNDLLDGGDGNDVLNGGDNTSADTVLGSRGKDKIIFSDNVEGYHSLDYGDGSIFFRGVDVNVNLVRNKGTVDKGVAGLDTLIDAYNPANAGWLYDTGGLGINGSFGDDSFKIVTAKDSWIEIGGYEGVDSYDLTLNSDSIVRLNFYGATNGVKVNMRKDVIIDDGLGNRETLTVKDNGGALEINGTAFADRMIGANGDDRFITLGGNDFVDGGKGRDMVRYDRNGVDAVEVDLAKGIATGSYEGQGFRDKLKNIEDIRGSRYGDDTLSGNNKANTLDGNGGNDVLNGRNGNDRLFGGDGDDVLNGGNGKDELIGGAGNDMLTGGGGRDLFIFNANLDEGRDVVVDFQDGIDRIRIEGADYSDLTIRKFGKNHVLVELDSGTEIVLRDTVKSDIDANDFIFV